MDAVSDFFNVVFTGLMVAGIVVCILGVLAIVEVLFEIRRIKLQTLKNIRQTRRRTIHVTDPKESDNDKAV